MKSCALDFATFCSNIKAFFMMILFLTLCTVHCLSLDTSGKSKAINVIFILADDLGYGDLGFSPFNSALMRNLKTPELEKMAKRGMKLNNFHTASPICSPSRASIMVNR
jgi:hypothetical protein